MTGGFDEVERNLDKLEADLRRRAARAMDEVGIHLANYAKTHHLWTPRTGATDVSTVGGLYEETQEYVRAVLSAGMTYNVFLELARSGRWSWLKPAVDANHSTILRIIERHMTL